MGVAIGDYDHDGRDDIHVTNFADDSNLLYHNDGKGMFTEVAATPGDATAGALEGDEPRAMRRWAVDE